MIYKFSAPWCQPCSQLSKVLEDMELQVTEVDIDQEPNLAAEYRVRGIPTLVYVFEGAEYGRITGLKTAKEISEWIADCEEQF